MSQKKVLLIDDVKVQRKSVEHIFHNSDQLTGIELITASSGEQGLEVLREGEVDVVVVDWMMPKMSGIEFIDEMKKMENSANTPVLICTSRATESDVKEAIEHGIHGYITKPLVKTIFVDKIMTFLKND